MKITNKIAIGAVGLLVLTNPLVAAQVDIVLSMAFSLIMQYSGYVSAVALVYLVTLFVVREKRKSPLKVPKNGTKVKGSGLKYELSK